MNEDCKPNLVSVIIPTYNRAKLLVEAMDSVWNQIYRPIELLVIDDGSTDDIKTAVDLWKEKHPDDSEFELRYFYQENKGGSVARNLGLSRSRGEFIQFLDSDDFLHPQKLSRQVPLLQTHPELDGTVCEAVYLNQRLQYISATKLSQSGDISFTPAFSVHNQFPIHAPLHRRAMLAKLGGFDERLQCAQETNLHLRLAIAGARFSFTPEILASVLFHRQGQHITDRFEAIPNGYYLEFYTCLIELCDSTRRDGAAFKRAVAEHLFRMALRYFAKLKPIIATACLQGATQIYPKYSPFRKRIYLAPGGWIIGIVVESTVRVLSAASRHTQTCTNMLDRIIRALKASSRISMAIKRWLPGVIQVGVSAMSRRRTLHGVTRFFKTYPSRPRPCEDMLQELRAREIFKDKAWITPILDYGDNWFALPFFRSELMLDNLAQCLDAGARFKIACEVVSILFEIFMEGYAHRDVHSRNLFLLNGRVIMVDFEKLAPYPAGMRPPFPRSYDLIGEGLSSPFHPPMYYSADTHPNALQNVLRVPLNQVLDTMTYEFKRRLREVCKTFRSCNGRGYSRRFVYADSNRIYSSFRLPYITVSPDEAQRDSQKRLTKFGITREVLQHKRVLDLGSNIGGILFECLQYSPSQCLGVEYDSEKVILANQIAAFNGLNNMCFIKGDIDRIDPTDLGGPFDVVFCLAVESHVKSVAHLYRLLGDITKDVLYFEGNSTTDVTYASSKLLGNGFRQVDHIGLSDDDYLARNNCRPLFVARKQ